MVCPPWDSDKQEIVSMDWALYSTAISSSAMYDLFKNVSDFRCLDDSHKYSKPYCAYSEGAKHMGPFDLVVLFVVTMVISLEVVKELDQLQVPSTRVHRSGPSLSVAPNQTALPRGPNPPAEHGHLRLVPPHA